MYILKQFGAVLRLRWVPGFVLLSAMGVVVAFILGHDSALERDPAFTFDEILTALAGVLTTIVATTFSAVFVALTLASAQFSPRIVRSFFREDWRVQLVFALFVLSISHIFILKFLGLTRLDTVFQLFGQTILHAEVAIGFAIFLIMVVFPYFVYYLIRNINAAKITKNIAERTIWEIERGFRHKWTLLDPGRPDNTPFADAGENLRVLSKDRGYLDHYNPLALQIVRLLGHHVHIHKFVGSFVSKGSVMAVVDYAGNGRLKRQLLARLVRAGMVLKEYRSYTQDVNFGIRQLVDIAIKAISPAVNDPTTAITCINYLGEIVKEFAQYRLPSKATERLSAHHVHIHEYDFEKVVDHAFNQIHQWGRTDHMIVRHLVHTVTELIQSNENPANLLVLVREVEEMELLGKSSEELKAIFLYQEYVDSLQRNYLRRFLKAAIAAVDAVHARIGQLNPADQASCLALHARDLETLANVKTRFLAYLAASAKT